MSKFRINFIAFISASLVVFFIGYLFESYIIKNFFYYIKQIDIKDNTSSLLKNTFKLQEDLESGKLVLFGSSELTNHSHKYIPENFFNKTLKQPLISNGHAGHQSFAIMTQLAALSNKKVKENARVIVFLSPGWFEKPYAKGTNIASFLEYVDSIMLYKLYFESDVSEHYKKLVSSYIRKHFFSIKNPSFSYVYSAIYPYNSIFFLQKKFIRKNLEKLKNHKIKKIIYNIPSLNWENLKKDALKNAEPSTNNEYGINNDYYTKYVLPNIKKGKFPHKIEVPSIKNNQEYKDFLNLTRLLKDYKIKPLFIMQDQNPYAYTNRESMLPILSKIKKELKKYGYGYLDMWTYRKEDYKIGKLTDVMHTGELGWIEIDKKIIEHFFKNKERGVGNVK